MASWRLAAGLSLCAAAVLGPGSAAGAPLTIYDIQYTAAADGASAQAGNTVDCSGGVVTFKWWGGQPKLFLQDPARSDWAGIQVKDWTGGQLYNSVSPGDCVSLSNVYVEEFRGNTILKYHGDYQSGFTVVSTGNALPAALAVAPSAIAAPAEGPPGQWYVADRSAEKYESMLLTVADVTVTQVDLGKAVDNYLLEDSGGNGCWAGDYMNAEVGPDGYHPYIGLGVHFDSVTGVVEQYTKLSSYWDYYQLLTRQRSDLVPEPATLGLLLAGAAGLLRRGRRDFR